eukprot:gene30573-40416_t
MRGTNAGAAGDQRRPSSRSAGTALGVPPPHGAVTRAGGGLDMFMDGFKVASSRDTNGCVILLFRAWTLNTRAKFAGGCVGVFLLGFVTDMTVWVRRKLVFGYGVMLVVMIYSVELFLC